MECGAETIIREPRQLYRNRHRMHTFRLWYDCSHCKSKQPFGPSMYTSIPDAMTFRRESYRHFMGTGFVIFEGAMILFICFLILNLVITLFT
jgi:hypothetical protein